MNLLGRDREIALLNDLYHSKQAEFLALYGRRRVGKTFLIRRFFEQKKNTLFFNVTGLKDGKIAEQIANFMDRLSEIFYDGLRLASEPQWRNVFKLLNDAIARQPKSRKIVIFLDELPWMATAKSRLLQAVDYYWNQYWSDNANVKLIICGSSASWIINKIIKNKGGLHNRITEKICLKPFNLHDTKEYLSSKNIHLNNQQVLLLYMVTGGVPYYLSRIKWKLSATQIIEKLAFTEKAFLMEEFDSLFSSLFNNHQVHINIVRALARHPSGIGKTKLLEMAGSIGGTNAEKLQELVDAGFIMQFKPIFHRRKGIYYRLIDEYTSFYLKWIEPLRDTLQIQALDKGNWQAMRSTPKWYNWQGHAFEAVCYKHLVQIRRALDILPTAVAHSWRYVSTHQVDDQSGVQIDLLFDRQDHVITIVEVKCTEKPFTISKDYLENLRRKLAVFAEKTKTQKQLLLSFVSMNGIKQNDYANEIVTGVVTLDDLFESV